MAQPTLLDIVRRNNNDGVVGLVEESVQVSPELTVGASRSISGIGFDALIRTALPAVGFRNVNEGVDPVVSTFVKRHVSLALVDASTEVDKAAGQASEDGLDALLADEASGMLEQGFRSLSSQFYYGSATVVETSVAASPLKGYPGLIETYDATNMQETAGGVGTLRSSVWMVKFGPKYVQWLIGNDGILDVSPAFDVRLTDGTGNPYDGVRKPMTFWAGVSNVNPRNSAVRISNLTVAVPLTDDILYAGLERFPAAIVPDAIFMSKRSLFQLRASRTATNATGAPAPLPNDAVGGIPIFQTGAILDTENA